MRRGVLAAMAMSLAVCLGLWPEPTYLTTSPAPLLPPVWGIDPQIVRAAVAGDLDCKPGAYC